MFGWFSKRGGSSKVEEETKKGFEAVKKDITAVTGWIRHLDSEKNLLKKELEEIKDILSSTQEEIEGIKNIVSIILLIISEKALNIFLLSNPRQTIDFTFNFTISINGI